MPAFDKYLARDRRQLYVWPPTLLVKTVRKPPGPEAGLMDLVWLFNNPLLLALFILTDQLSPGSIDSGGWQEGGRPGCVMDEPAKSWVASAKWGKRAAEASVRAQPIITQCVVFRARTEVSGNRICRIEDMFAGFSTFTILLHQAKEIFTL